MYSHCLNDLLPMKRMRKHDAGVTITSCRLLRLKGSSVVLLDFQITFYTLVYIIT